MVSITGDRKKVVYLIGTLRIGGAQRQVVETAARLNREIFEAKLYCLFGGGPLYGNATKRGVDVTVFDALVHNPQRTESLHFKRCRQFLSLWRYLWQEQPDIVHCYMYKPCIYGGIATKLNNASILITNRRSLGFFKEKKLYYQFMENVVNRFTDRVLVNSQAVKHDVLQRETLSPDKIHVLYNGVDIGEYTPADPREESHIRQKKSAFGIPQTVPVIGMIANLFPYKGYREFLVAASKVHQTYPEARFLCIGEDCGIQADLEQLSGKLGIRQHVMFTGQIQNIPEILHLIDIQVLASHEEGFSNAILEGMASGKPLVATSVGGTPEAVVDNQTGLLVSPKDPDALAQAIISLLANPERATQLGVNARKRVEEHFSFDRMADNLEALYLNLLEQQKEHDGN